MARLESLSDPWQRIQIQIPLEPGIVLGRSNSALKITSRHVSREQVRIFLSCDRSHVEAEALGGKKAAWILRRDRKEEEEENPEILQASSGRVHVGRRDFRAGVSPSWHGMAWHYIMAPLCSCSLGTDCTSRGWMVAWHVDGR